MTTLLMVSLMFSGCVSIHLGPGAGDPLQEQTLETQDGAEKKVLLISIEGMIANEPESGLLSQRPGMIDRVTMQLRKAAEDPEIVAVVLRIDSPGGGVTASDILYRELQRFRQNTGKKLVVQMMDVAASGGYYIALAAEEIYAHPTTLTGSVGVISLTADVTGLTRKLGVEVHTYKSGEKKDVGSPFRPHQPEDAVYWQSLIDRMAARFHALVQERRQLNDQAMQSIKTARIYLGEQAVGAGLVDAVAYLPETLERACRLGGAKACETVAYRFDLNPNANRYSPGMQSPYAPSLSLLPGAELSERWLKPGQYYLYWPENAP
ncbi:signal peptide peptidase SppA [Hydrogenovibrio halophilus]|uniref:signal peptide peptidase SppA n=1 Tax=Hydrogenovibrio halophilus TaxID=373391 RepID=UPI0012FE2D92|nr:signal peptide peptidase SppA [Hydrogenovibrio halophilus]